MMRETTPDRNVDAKPSLNTELVAELQSLLGEDFGELVLTFQRDSDTLSKQVQALAVAKQAEHLRRIAHSLKGSASNMGAVRLANCWAQVETLSLEPNPSFVIIDTEIQAAMREYQVVTALLSAYLAETAS